MTDELALVTIPNVPILTTGTYDLASGNTTFTADHLAAAVAAQDDPAVQSPRLKIGHESDFGDGEPCFGKVINMHMGDNGQTIYGDYVGVPAWLAELMPSAYPSRSVEGMFNEETATGKKHSLLITAVSLLGVVAPGVSTLEDLKNLYGAETPSGVEVKAGEKIVAKRVGGDMGKTIAASVEVDDVKRAFYESLGPDQMWWWIRAVRIDPTDLIVDDDEGSLYRVPFTINGDEVTFSDPVEVQIVYVDVGSNKATAALGAAGGGHPVAVYAKRSESRPDTEGKETRVDPKELRASLGLAEDASDEAVKAKLKELRASEESDDDGGAGDGDTPDDDADEDEEDESDGEESDDEDEADDEGGSEETTASIDRGTLSRLQSDAKAGREAKAKQDRDERDALIEAACKEGKFGRDRKAHWAKLYNKDPEGTKATIAKLEKGLVPVEEHGSGGDGGEAEINASQYDDSWLSPGERQRIEAARSGAGSGRVTQEVK